MKPIQLPAEDAYITTTDGMETIECRRITVPVGEDGMPTVNRIGTDSKNNLTVYVDQNEMRMFHERNWLSVRLVERVVMKAVKNAS